MRALRSVPFWLLALIAPALVAMGAGALLVLAAAYLTALAIGAALLPFVAVLRLISAIVSRPKQESS